MQQQFPDNGNNIAWPNPPGGVNSAAAAPWTPPAPETYAMPPVNGGDFPVNVGAAAGAVQLQYDPNAPMPFDPTANGQMGGQMGGHMSGHMSGQMGGQMSGQMSGHFGGGAADGGMGAGAGAGAGVGVDAFVNNPFGQMALNGAQNMLQNQAQRFLNPTSIGRLKYYFAVDNSYVIRKLKILLFPFRHQDWKRQTEPGSPPAIDINGTHGHAAEPVYLPPRMDVNAPDLYIPAMAFFTFALLTGYVMGTAGQFNPESLLSVCSYTFVVLVLEVALFRIGFSWIDSGAPKLLDLIAWSGYKYVGLIVALFVGIAFGDWPFFIAKSLMGSASALFLMCTLHRALAPAVEASHGGVVPTSSKRNYFLVLIGVVQVLLVFVLLRSVVLPTAAAAIAPLFGAAPPTIIATAAGGAAAVGAV